jgi:hypothetical protein
MIVFLQKFSDAEDLLLLDLLFVCCNHITETSVSVFASIVSQKQSYRVQSFVLRC